MPAGYRVSRRISRRLRLTRVVRETYMHSDLVCIPPEYHFRRPILVPTAEILNNLPGVLLLEDFDFILCSSVLKAVSLPVQSLVDRSSSSLFIFPDEFVSETFSSGPFSALSFHRRHYPSATFHLLSPETAPQILSAFPDMLASLAASSDPHLSSPAFNPLHLFRQSCSSTPELSNGSTQAVFPSAKELDTREIVPGTSAEEAKDYAFSAQHRDNSLLAEQLFRAGVAARGTLIVDPHRGPGGVMCGEVIGTGNRILLSGAQMGGALHGDEVYVTQNSVIGVARARQRRAAGTVISVASAPQYISSRSENPPVFALVRPVDRRLPDFAVSADSGMQVGTKVLIYISDSGRGVIVRRLKEFDSSGTTVEEMTRLEEESLLTHFSVLESATSLEGANLRCDSSHCQSAVNYDDSKRESRVDLRSLTIISVDPEGCTDIDDALHCIKTEQGFEVGVHIADVSHVVPEDTQIDREARVRGTTVYLPGRRVDMLPEVLSSGLCSLLPFKEKDCVSVVFTMDTECNITDTRVFRSRVATRAALSYEQAQAAIDSPDSAGHRNGLQSEKVNENSKKNLDYSLRSSEGKSFKTGDFDVDDIDEPIKETLRLLAHVARVLRTRRASQGALILNDVADDLPGSDTESIKEVDTHAMVEELMVLANASVATFIVRHCPEYSLLRRHPPPEKSDFARNTERVRGEEAEIGNRAPSGDENARTTRSVSREVMRRVVGRSMQQAVYFVSGDAEDPLHYGLALKMYTHFTSPIRRYADLVVHRTVIRIIEAGETERISEKVDAKLCNLLNWRTRNAKAISRLSSELHAAQKLVKNQEMEAVVMERRCFVELETENSSKSFMWIKESDDSTESRSEAETQNSSGEKEKKIRRTYLVLLPELGIEAVVEDKAEKERILRPFEYLRVRVLSDFWDYCRDREVYLEMV